MNATVPPPSPRRGPRPAVLILTLLGLLAGSPHRHTEAAQAAPAPRIERLSPPSWWPEAGPRDLMVLVEGANLTGAVVRTERPGVTIRRTESPGAGHSLFIDLRLAADLEPGPVPLTIAVGDAQTIARFEIVPRPTRRPDPLGPDDVIYLVMPDRFANGEPGNDAAGTAEPMLDRANPRAYHGGDFAGLRERLPYLADLGVTALWLTPIYQAGPRWFRSSNARGQTTLFADYHGYSAVDHFATNPQLGSLADYRALVDEAHRLGLKVIQDQVLGHVGPQHRWAQQPPATDWLHGPVGRPLSCNFRLDALANPHASAADRRGLTDGWFFGILPDLATETERVRQFAIQQSLWWTVLFEADALRLDTYPMIDRGFWRDWSRAQAAVDPARLALGEAWTTDPAVLPFYQGGRVGWDGIDPGVGAVFDFPLQQALQQVATGGAPAKALGQVLARDGLFPRPDRLVTFLDNHDMPRFAGLTGVDAARQELAATFLLTTRGIPQLTWGNEIGLLGHGDDRRDFPGGWPGDAHDAFTPDGRTPAEAATFATFRTLLHLRRDHEALRRGDLTELIATDTVYAFVRRTGAEIVVVALNFGDQAASVRLPREPLGPASAAERLHGEGTLTLEADAASLALPAHRAVLFLLK